jgi:hypothetical protein
VPGLYFAGALAHGHDWRRSSGGFIHGFRYTARALVKSLREDREEVGGWAGATLGDENHTCTPGALLCSALQRKAVIEALSRSAGSGDGIYQNFGELAAVVVLESAVEDATQVRLGAMLYHQV